MKKDIKIKSVEDIKKINSVASKYHFDIWLHSKNSMADAKSILGLLTLNPKESMSLVVEDNVNASSLFKELSEYIAK